MNHIEIIKKGAEYWNEWRENNRRVRPNLRGTIMTQANLSGANLSGTVLTHADLSSAVLTHADLSCSNLSKSDLRRANLRKVNLSRSTLYGTNMKEADLYGANLSGTNLSGVNLYGAYNIFRFGPMPTSGRIVYAVRHDAGWMVNAGCFWGTLEELEAKVKEKHNCPMYLGIIETLKKIK